ncbi:fasciclin-1 [Anabrus simplex]|uniref:fasciclin-1 n=1 Tax=Anabrus simplex TaxID=316456 RepID=UPI0035A3C297
MPPHTMTPPPPPPPSYWSCSTMFLWLYRLPGSLLINVLQESFCKLKREESVGVKSRTRLTQEPHAAREPRCDQPCYIAYAHRLPARPLTVEAVHSVSTSALDCQALKVTLEVSKHTLSRLVYILLREIFFIKVLRMKPDLPYTPKWKKEIDERIKKREDIWEECYTTEAMTVQFYTLLENSPVANATLRYRQATIFAPTNEAFQNYDRKDQDDSIFLYHMTNLAQTLHQLGSQVLSELEGNPPLWVTRRRGPQGEEIYINNARIIPGRSDYVTTNVANKQQVLHVIDRVLEPVMTSSSSRIQLYNPDALQFLNHSENLDLGMHRVRSFRQRVYQNQKAEVFRAEGHHTFFIPVDEGFKPPPRPEKIDQKVIDGHIIPSHALFTRATPSEVEYETLAFTDMMRVTISFTTQTDGKTSRTYVKSNTVLGDNSHANGVVLAEIVKANIPVKNGVVHLIHRPLMVVDNTVKQFLEEKEDGPLYKFYEVIMDLGGEFMTNITNMKELTLFAPSNSAWGDTNINKLLNDRNKLREILNLHLVAERLPIDVILEQNKNMVPTAADHHKKLYFNVVTRENNQTLTVEGGGVNATVIQPNIAATNGIVHIIDRVLGVPYTTVQEKLQTDPMLNKTYHLGMNDGFNDMLGDTQKKFTYFVPRDLAWKKLELRYPSVHKKLFMKDFSYHVRPILERHLVVSDRVFTMAQLRERTLNDTVLLPTIRDHLKIWVKETDKSYTIEWDSEKINVFRPDVECTNGIIHVIDSVFLKERDVNVAGNGGVSLLVPHIVMLFAANWLLL